MLKSNDFILNDDGDKVGNAGVVGDDDEMVMRKEIEKKPQK